MPDTQVVLTETLNLEPSLQSAAERLGPRTSISFAPLALPSLGPESQWDEPGSNPDAGALSKPNLAGLYISGYWLGDWIIKSHTTTSETTKGIVVCLNRLDKNRHPTPYCKLFTLL